MRRGRDAKQRVWLGPGRYRGCCRNAAAHSTASFPNADTICNSVRAYGNTNANANAYADSYGDGDSNAQCDSYSDSYCDCNANTERNAKRHTDSDTYCNSQRVAYGYAKGNAQAAWDAAA
jgi:hypothetical protein